MSDFLALLETQVGKAVVARFAAVGNMTLEAMGTEILVNAPLAAYFVEVCRKVVSELKAEAA